MGRKEIAENYFLEGYNCSQSLLLAFKDILKDDFDAILKASVPLGGGISRLRETCGVVSAMCLIIGYVFGYVTPETTNKKEELYFKTQEIIKAFENQFGSLCCRELLKLDVKHDSPTPSKRDKKFYNSRPCKDLIGGGAMLLEKYLIKYGVLNND